MDNGRGLGEVAYGPEADVLGEGAQLLRWEGTEAVRFHERLSRTVQESAGAA